MEPTKEISKIQTGDKVIEIAKGGNTVLWAKICRSARDGGLQIKVSSAFNWKLLGREDKTVVFGNQKCFAPKKEILPNVPGCFKVDNLAYMVDGQQPNLMILLAEELAEGKEVTYNFGPMPVSDETMAEWKTKLYDQIKILYLTYFKPTSYEVCITSVAVERENFA